MANKNQKVFGIQEIPPQLDEAKEFDPKSHLSRRNPVVSDDDESWREIGDKSPYTPLNFDD